MSKQDASFDGLIIKVRVPKGFPLCSQLEGLGVRDRAGQLLMYANVGFHLAHPVAGAAPAMRKATPPATQSVSAPAGPDQAPDAEPEAQPLDMGFVNNFLDPTRLGLASSS